MKIKIPKIYQDKLNNVLKHLDKNNSFDLSLILNNIDYKNNITISETLYDYILDELYTIVEENPEHLDVLEFLLNKDTRKETIL